MSGAEAEEHDPRDERAKKREGEARPLETNESRSQAETIGGNSDLYFCFAASPRLFYKYLLQVFTTIITGDHSYCFY